MRKLFHFVMVGFMGSVFLLSACKKKERLTASTFGFSITPPTTSVLKTESVTLTARGSSSAGPIEVSPTWSVSPDSVGLLSTSLGTTVVFQPVTLGDVTISATVDGLTATSQIAVVTYRPTSNTFDVYNDDGLPIGTNIESDIITSGSFLSELSSGYTPEGIKYQRASSVTSGASWGVTLDDSNTGKHQDLSAFSAGTLKFSLRLARTMAVAGDSIRIELTDTLGVPDTFTLVSGSDGYNRLSTDWQEISLSLSSRFPGLDLSNVKVPFAIATPTLAQALTFDIDAVRWEK